MSDAPDLQFDPPTQAAPQKWYSPQTIIPALAMIGTVLVVVVAVIPSIIAARAPVIAEAEAKAAAEASATASKEAFAVVALMSTEEAAVTNPVPVTSASVEATAVSTDAPTTASRATSVPATTAPTQLAPTTAPTNTPTNISATPTLAAAPNVTLFYDQDAFTIFNNSGAHLSLEGVIFQGPDVAWEASSLGTTVKALPKTRCLRIRDAQAGNRIPPAECGGQIHGFREVESAAVFWRGDSFDVLRDGAVIATCQTAAGKCELYVAQ